ncbi:MAG: EVE domain-containing protein [Stellaceae bacterium]
MNHWLLKSEPGTFGIDDLASLPKRTVAWDGVRNYQARNMLRDAVKKGDFALFYHSSCDTPGVVGIVRVVKEGYPDATAFDPKHHHYDADSRPGDPRWYCVDIKLVRKFDRIITLDALRKHAGLSEAVHIATTCERPMRRIACKLIIRVYTRSPD